MKHNSNKKLQKGSIIPLLDILFVIGGILLLIHGLSKNTDTLASMSRAFGEVIKSMKLK